MICICNWHGIGQYWPATRDKHFMFVLCLILPSLDHDIDTNNLCWDALSRSSSHGSYGFMWFETYLYCCTYLECGNVD